MTLKYIAVAVVVLVVMGGLYIRFAPVSAETYHVEDVDTLVQSGQGGQFSAGNGGDIPAVENELSFEVMGPALADMITRTPGTSWLAGSLSSGGSDRRVASYVTRSKVIGFPDVTNVQIDRIEGATRITMNGQQVYGVEDFGVNEARIRAWLNRLEIPD